MADGWLAAGVSSKENASPYAVYFLTMSSRLLNLLRSAQSRLLSIFTVTEPCGAVCRNNGCLLASFTWNTFSPAPTSRGSRSKQPLWLAPFPVTAQTLSLIENGPFEFVVLWTQASFSYYTFPPIWLLQMTSEAGGEASVWPTKHMQFSISNVYSGWLLYWKRRA